MISIENARIFDPIKTLEFDQVHALGLTIDRGGVFSPFQCDGKNRIYNPRTLEVFATGPNWARTYKIWDSAGQPS